MSEEKKYSGYGYHGGGRKRLSPSGRKALQLSLKEEEILRVKALAEEAECSVSQFVMRCVLFWAEHK